MKVNQELLNKIHEIVSKITIKDASKTERSLEPGSKFEFDGGVYLTIEEHEVPIPSLYDSLELESRTRKETQYIIETLKVYPTTRWEPEDYDVVHHMTTTKPWEAIAEIYRLLVHEIVADIEEGVIDW